MMYWIWTWKILEPPYWTRNNFICWNWHWKILELPYWIWIDFICLWYIGLWLEKHSSSSLPYKTWTDFIKHWARINQPSRDFVTKVWRLSWINCFLFFNVVLIHAARYFVHDDISIHIAFYAALDIACHCDICQ